MSTLLSVLLALPSLAVLTFVTFAPQIILFVSVWIAVYIYRRNLSKLPTPTRTTKFLDVALTGFVVAAILAVVLWVAGLTVLFAAIKADSGVTKSRAMPLWTDQYLK